MYKNVKNLQLQAQKPESLYSTHQTNYFLRDKKRQSP